MNEVCLIWKIIHESYLQGVERNRKQSKIEMVEVEKKRINERQVHWVTRSSWPTQTEFYIC